MSTKIHIAEENTPKQFTESANISFDEIQRELIFCPYCLMIPEYYIKLSKSNFSLVHTCINNEIIEKPFIIGFHEFKFKCIYCTKKCDKVCLKCKNLICKECLKEHYNNYYKHRKDNEIKFEDPFNS